MDPQPDRMTRIFEGVRLTLVRITNYYPVAQLWTDFVSHWESNPDQAARDSLVNQLNEFLLYFLPERAQEEHNRMFKQYPNWLFADFSQTQLNLGNDPAVPKGLRAKAFGRVLYGIQRGRAHFKREAARQASVFATYYSQWQQIDSGLVIPTEPTAVAMPTTILVLASE